MICTRCLQRRVADALLYTPLPLPRPHPLFSASRYLSSSSPRRVTETPPTVATPPPFSTPFTPTSAPSPDSVAAAADTPQKPPRSKTPAGIPLKGLGYLKNHDAPRAWADDQYPPWLWGLLDADGKGDGGKKEAGGGGSGGEGEGGGDMFSKSKKQRRVAAKLARIAAIEDPSSLIPKIPLQHQSIDLAHGEGTGKEGEEGRNAREELTKTMRTARRKAIKEKNFLSGMR